jgi:hypothetical protein
MSKGGVNTFVFIVHFLNDQWESCYITIGFFETLNTFGPTMAIQVNDMLTRHRFNVRVHAYAKDEGTHHKLLGEK